MTSDDYLIRMRDGMRCRLLKRIPKGSRLAAAEKLTQLLTIVIANHNNLEAWIHLMLFPSCCLKVPGSRGGRKHKKALAGKLNQIIRLYPGKPVASNELPRAHRFAVAQKSFNKRTEMERLAARVSEMLEDCDVKGAVRLAASEEIMAPYNQNTVDALISKHPRAVRPPQYSANDEVEPLQLQEADIAAAIKSFPAVRREAWMG